VVRKTEFLVVKISVEVDSEDIGQLFLILQSYQEEEKRYLTNGGRGAKKKAKEAHEAGLKLWNQIRKLL
jgi:hypothetical protein